MTPRRFRLSIAVMVMLGCLVPALAAASGKAGTEKTPPKPPTPTTVQELRLAMPDSAPTVDPALVADEENVQLANLLYIGLVRLDAKYHVRLAAAQHIDVSPDHRHYTFHIRPGLRFSNGDPITSYDFQFALTRSLNPALKSPSAPFYLLDIEGADATLEGKAQTVSGIEAPNSHILKITTRWPVAYFLMELTYPTSFALDKKAVTKLGSPLNTSWYLKPITSGPFRLKSLVANDKMVLVPNKYYAGAKSSITQVSISLSPLPVTDLYSYISHNLDIVSLRAYDASLLHQPGVHATKALSIDGLYMDFSAKPFNNRSVRLALAMALPRQKLTQDAMGKTITPFFGYVPPGQNGYDPGLKSPAYDPKGARAQLKKAGYSSTKTFPSITLSYVANPALDRLVAGIVQAWHTNLKITVATQALTDSTLFTRVQSGSLPLYLYGWSADYPDPHDWLSLQWKTGAPNNNTHYHNKRFDDLVSSADVTWHAGKRLQLYNSAQSVLVHDLAWLPLYIPHRIAYVRPGVTNVTVTGYGIIPQAGSWSMVKVRSSLPGSRGFR
jgi:ABC-type oligopeptide transport system substrate-binding subunit